MMQPPIHISRFTPSRMPHDTLEAIFVQRNEIATDTVARIRDAVVQDNKHYLLFIGPRGCGKTHFISLVYHRANAAADLKDSLRIAWLDEDKTSTSALDLNIRIYKALNAAFPNEFPAEPLQRVYDQDATWAMKYISRLLNEQLGDKTALILVENLDTLFEDLGTDGQHAWRAFLQESGKFTIVATAQQLVPSLSDRTRPFFGFLYTSYFEPLNVQQGCALLTKIATQQRDEQLVSFLATAEGRSRVRALHHLAGGNHRVFVIFSEFIDRQSLDDLVAPFEKTLDELTPYYQQRLRWLSPQQRAIVEHLCECDYPVPVRDIAKALFTSNQSIAKQLDKLKKNRYVRSATRGRESLYELTEPLMRLASHLKTSELNQHGAPLRPVVDFLRIWYCDEEPEPAFAGAQTLLSHGEWDKGWAKLAQYLGDDPPNELALRACRDLIPIILRSTQAHEDWLARVGKLCEIYANVGAPTYLGEGLVRSLLYLREKPLASEALLRWQQVWHAVGDQYGALAFALRLFDVGIAYIKTGEANRLLDLPLEQRAILEQLFNLDMAHG